MKSKSLVPASMIYPLALTFIVACLECVVLLNFFNNYFPIFPDKAVTIYLVISVFFSVIATFIRYDYAEETWAQRYLLGFVNGFVAPIQPLRVIFVTLPYLSRHNPQRNH